MIKQILKGVVIGIANIIPGVSGGTMAVSMGIYDKLISSLTNIFKDFKNSIKTLVPIFIGVGIGIIGLTFLIEKLLASFPVQTNFMFIGLIVGGLPFILKKVKGSKPTIGNVLAFLIFFGIVVIFALMGEKDGKEAQLSVNLLSMAKMFGVGVIASATMVIPGVSGSMILMLMGYYSPILSTITGFFRSLAAADIAALMNDAMILMPFGIGMIIGIFAIANIIELIFKKAPILAYWAIIGLILASPIAILVTTKASAFSVISVLIGLVTFAIGCIIAYKLGEE